MRKEIDSRLASAHEPSSSSQFLARKGSKSKLITSGKRHSEVDIKYSMDDKFLKSKGKRQKHNENGSDAKNAVESKMLEVKFEKPASSADRKGKKRQKEDGLPKSSKKKMKT